MYFSLFAHIKSEIEEWAYKSPDSAKNVLMTQTKIYKKRETCTSCLSHSSRRLGIAQTVRTSNLDLTPIYYIESLKYTILYITSTSPWERFVLYKYKYVYNEGCI